MCPTDVNCRAPLLNHSIRIGGSRLVSTVTFPFIRSNSIEFYFLSVSVARRPGAPPTRKRGKLVRQPTGPAGPIDNSTRLFGTESPNRQRHYGNGVTERQYGHGFAETVTEAHTDERKRDAGNQASPVAQFCSRECENCQQYKDI